MYQTIHTFLLSSVDWSQAQSTSPQTHVWGSWKVCHNLWAGSWGKGRSALEGNLTQEGKRTELRDVFVFVLFASGWMEATNSGTTFQLVYKVKLDFVLEQLASASVGGYGQDVWSELVEEARSNLTKIAVCLCGVMMMLLFFFQTLIEIVKQVKKSQSKPAGSILPSQFFWLSDIHWCGSLRWCSGWAVRGGVLPEGPLAHLPDGGEDAGSCCGALRLPAHPGGPGQAGHLLQPPRPPQLQVRPEARFTLTCFSCPPSADLWATVAFVSADCGRDISTVYWWYRYWLNWPSVTVLKMIQNSSQHQPWWKLSPVGGPKLCQITLIRTPFVGGGYNHPDDRWITRKIVPSWSKNKWATLREFFSWNSNWLTDTHAWLFFSNYKPYRHWCSHSTCLFLWCDVWFHVNDCRTPCASPLVPVSGIGWIQFLNSTDNMAEVQCQLRDGDLKGAQLLWLRHEVTQTPWASQRDGKMEKSVQQMTCLADKMIMITWLWNVGGTLIGLGCSQWGTVNQQH